MNIRLNKSASTIDHDHGSSAEVFSHEIEIGLSNIFRLPDAANGQRLAGWKLGQSSIDIGLFA